MMRVFSAILAFYILGLLFIPCADIHKENGAEISCVKIPDKHEDNFDTCSPFCFCNCCQTLSHLEFQIITSLTIQDFETVNSEIIESEYQVYRSLWRPPKI